MDSDDILALLRATADEIIRPRFCALGEGQVEEKEPGDLVTIADREAEAVIAERLRQEFPEALVIGEEATAADPSLTDALGQAEHAFTIDPVDGTRNFVEGVPDYAVMLGELRAGEAVRAWIWLPEHEVAYVAEAGAGVLRNGERLTPIPRSADPAGLRGATSSALRGTAPGPLPVLGTPPWSAGVAYVHVLEGQLDYTLFRKDWPWDHVPGSLMAAELGGVTGRLDGTAYEPSARSGWLLTAADRQIFDVARTPLAEALGV